MEKDIKATQHGVYVGPQKLQSTGHVIAFSEP